MRGRRPHLLFGRLSRLVPLLSRLRCPLIQLVLKYQVVLSSLPDGVLLGGTRPIQAVRPRGLMIVKELSEAARVGAVMLILGSLRLRPHVELPRVAMCGRLMQRGDTPVVAQQGRLGAGVQRHRLLRQRVGRLVRVRVGQEMVGGLMLHEFACEGRIVVVRVVMRLCFQSLRQTEVGWLESVVVGL
jgi:hypothetical protein